MTETQDRKLPLEGTRVVEFVHMVMGPTCGMVLADLGAEVIKVEPPQGDNTRRLLGSGAGFFPLFNRNKKSIALDLKSPQGLALARDLVCRADVLVEGFRPGVMESLGIGPEVCLKLCPSLVYGRVTGWGQTGPLSQAAGHDINYVALSGALHSNRRAGEAPTVAPGLIGDFGGGGMLLAFGVLAALAHAKQTGEGQVVDAAITDGAALLTALIQGWHSAGLWSNEAGTNNGDGGAHFYNTYQCADGKWLALHMSSPPKFWENLATAVGQPDMLSLPAFESRDARIANYEKVAAFLAPLFAAKPRAEWCATLEQLEVLGRRGACQ